jgi:hypothetical protein
MLRVRSYLRSDGTRSPPTTQRQGWMDPVTGLGLSGLIDEGTEVTVAAEITGEDFPVSLFG